MIFRYLAIYHRPISDSAWSVAESGIRNRTCADNGYCAIFRNFVNRNINQQTKDNGCRAVHNQCKWERPVYFF